MGLSGRCYLDQFTLLINLTAVLILVSQGCGALKCLQCISIECDPNESQLFCEGVKEYVLSQLPDLYYGYDSQRVPICPSPKDDDPAWEDLQKGVKQECDEEKADDATCALGRFRVTTEIYETGKHIITFGTAMGCAKPALLKKTREATKKGECDVSSSRNKFRHSLRHFLEIEHCARPPDMCHQEDFCIPPHATKIKIWYDTESEQKFSFTWILIIFLLLALAVGALTFMAPFFNG